MKIKIEIEIELANPLADKLRALAEARGLPEKETLLRTISAVTHYNLAEWIEDALEAEDFSKGTL